MSHSLFFYDPTQCCVFSCLLFHRGIPIHSLEHPSFLRGFPALASPVPLPHRTLSHSLQDLQSLHPIHSIAYPHWGPLLPHLSWGSQLYSKPGRQEPLRIQSITDPITSTKPKCPWVVTGARGSISRLHSGLCPGQLWVVD